MEENKEGKGESEFLVGRGAAHVSRWKSSLTRRHRNKGFEGRGVLMPISGHGVPAEEKANANALGDECTL